MFILIYLILLLFQISSVSNIYILNGSVYRTVEEKERYYVVNEKDTLAVLSFSPEFIILSDNKYSFIDIQRDYISVYDNKEELLKSFEGFVSAYSTESIIVYSNKKNSEGYCELFVYPDSTNVRFKEGFRKVVYNNDNAIMVDNKIYDMKLQVKDTIKKYFEGELNFSSSDITKFQLIPDSLLENSAVFLLGGEFYFLKDYLGKKLFNDEYKIVSKTDIVNRASYLPIILNKQVNVLTFSGNDYFPLLKGEKSKILGQFVFNEKSTITIEESGENYKVSCQKFSEQVEYISDSFPEILSIKYGIVIFKQKKEYVILKIFECIDEVLPFSIKQYKAYEDKLYILTSEDEIIEYQLN